MNINQEFLNTVCLKLNSRPRKSLNYQTPIQVLLNNSENFVAFKT